MAFPWLLYQKAIFLDSLVICGWSFIQLNITICCSLLLVLAVGNLPESWRMPSHGLSWRCDLAVLVSDGGALEWCLLLSYGAPWDCRCLSCTQKDEEAQLEHIRRHGGVSMVGMGLAFGFCLCLVGYPLVLIIAKQKANEVLLKCMILSKAHKICLRWLSHTRLQCPINTPLTTDNQKVTLKTLTKAEEYAYDQSLYDSSDGTGVSFPNRCSMIRRWP